jgi:cytochrome c551/c552
MKNIFISVGFIFATTFVMQAAPVKIELPRETDVYRIAPGADLANAQCLTCHSADYAAIQPPMPTKFWKAEVDKMAGKYGAPIPTNQVDALVEYFAKSYGTDAASAGTTSIAATTKEIASAASGDAKKLMQKTGCFNCHMVDKKFIGPAFKDVAGKYNGKADAFAKISHQIQNGGSGLWGPIPMPPFKQFSETEVKTLADWILAQK